MFKIAITGLILASLVGCVAIEPVKNMSQEDKVRLIHDYARAGTFTALSQMDDKEDRAEQLVEISNQALELILSESSIGPSTSELLLSQIPVEYEVWLTLTMSTFSAHYKTPTVGELISTENRELLAALFEGIRDGAKEFVVE